MYAWHHFSHRYCCRWIMNGAYLRSIDISEFQHEGTNTRSTPSRARPRAGGFNNGGDPDALLPLQEQPCSRCHIEGSESISASVPLDAISVIPRAGASCQDQAWSHGPSSSIGFLHHPPPYHYNIRFCLFCPFCSSPGTCEFLGGRVRSLAECLWVCAKEEQAIDDPAFQRRAGPLEKSREREQFLSPFCHLCFRVSHWRPALLLPRR